MAGIMFGPRLAGEIVQHVRGALGFTRGTSTGRINPPIPVGSGKFRHGKLDADLDCTGFLTVSATLSVWDDSGDTGENIEVYPPFAKPMGVILAGMKVEVQWEKDFSRYVVTAGGKARKIRATAKGDFLTSSSTIIGSYAIGHDGEDPVAVGADITIQNDGNVFFGLTGDYLFAEYSPETDTYLMYQKQCVEPTT